MKKKRNNLLRLLGYIRPYWFMYLSAVIMGLIKFLAPIGIIWVFGESIDVLNMQAAGELSSEEAWNGILRLLFIGVGIALASPVPTFLRSLLAAIASNRVIRDISCELYAHVQGLSHSFHDINRSGSLTSRIVSDTQTIKPFLSRIVVQFWMNIGVIIVVLTYLFSQNAVLGFLSVSLIPLQLIILFTIGRKVKVLSKKIRGKLSWLAGDTQEKLAATTVVKAFTQEDDEIQRFTEISEDIVLLGIKNASLNGLNHVFVSTLNALAPLLVIVIGGYMGIFHPENISIGLIVQFVMMQGHLYGPFQRLSESQLEAANALGATERIFEILDTPPDIKDRPGAVEVNEVQGNIGFEEVKFTYPGFSVGAGKVIDHLNLHIEAKKTVALVGPSGGGKSTVISLLNRFYDPDSGGITIDGVDIRDFKLSSLRSQIGLVPQDPMLFSGSVRENIRYGRPQASDGEVRCAAENANAMNFIMEMEEGMDSMIGESGTVLSGGQKQRLAIARAFLKDPAILLLDEATSALDSESERIVQEAIDKLMKNRTSIVIAHRLGTVISSDIIVVIENGKAVEQGTHGDLMRRGGLYSKLCEQQNLD